MILFFTKPDIYVKSNPPVSLNFLSPHLWKAPNPKKVTVRSPERKFPRQQRNLLKKSTDDVDDDAKISYTIVKIIYIGHCYDYSKTYFWWWRWLFWSQKDYLLSQVKFKLKMCTKRSTYCATQEFFLWQFLHLKYALLFLKFPPLYLKKYITTSIILTIYLVYFLLGLCWPSKFSNI